MPSAIQTITAEQLRELTNRLSEDQFVLLDVRQPEEYSQRHIPGAKLVPLGEIEAGSANIEPAEHTVVYCRSGARSWRAATTLVARDFMQGRALYNLEGGINAYEGITLAQFPRLGAFGNATTVEDIAKQAMEQEKGAHLLYDAMLEHFRGTAHQNTVERLAAAETEHAKELYNMLKATATSEMPSFEAMYDGMAGRLLESGEPLDAAVHALMEQPQQSHAAALELALQMEFEAYDLYRNMADRVVDQELKKAFTTLAGYEQAHARALLSALGTLPAE